VEDGVDGLLLPPDRPSDWARAIARLATHPGERAELGRVAERRSREFSIEASLYALAGLYEELLSSPGRSRREPQARAA
jgi:glycosyltransferase involved in cell wall biosynthesis